MFMYQRIGQATHLSLVTWSRLPCPLRAHCVHTLNWRLISALAYKYVYHMKTFILKESYRNVLGYCSILPVATMWYTVVRHPKASQELRDYSGPCDLRPLYLTIPCILRPDISDTMGIFSV